MRSVIRNYLLGIAAVAAILPAAANAADAKNQGYLTDTHGNIVRALGAKVCVRTSDWTPARAVMECDPDLVKKPAPPMKKVAPPPPPKKPAKKKKRKLLNITEKIELQGMPFDKAVMTADNKKDLDKFLRVLSKPKTRHGHRGPVKIGAVVVTGHTDRIGSLKYNQKLSERRAVVVKNYLVSHGVDQKLIFWEGKGPKQPIPVTKFCSNRMKRKQLIECLSPNRRVTVEIVGRAKDLRKPKAKKKR